ncbi:MAG: hypothetical protein M3160_00660 [Candidatus Eremiobacteraeota bacterium]|nr:hypothetical protein [Candidatus Eremiobacteraeota bacterium]
MQIQIGIHMVTDGKISNHFGIKRSTVSGQKAKPAIIATRVRITVDIIGLGTSADIYKPVARARMVR